MPAEAPPAALFNLDGLEDLARAASPELAAQVSSELGTPPGAEEPPPTPEADLTAPPVSDEPLPEGGLADEPTSNEDELAELNRQSEEAKAKKAAEAAPAVPTPAPDAPKPAPVATTRDDDLKLDEKASAHMHPKTKKVIEERNQKIITERNRADALAKEKLELQGKLSAAEEAAKKTVIPKGVEEEMTKLRERVRELDINHDPELVAKYDTPVLANKEKLITLLTGFGLGKTEDGKDDPAAIAALRKAGLDFKGLAPVIKKLSEAGAEDVAEEVREILRENIRLDREKAREIASWKTNYETKTAERQQQTQQSQAKVSTEIRAHTESFLKTDVEALTKDFPFMVRPPDPLPTDAPAVAKAKSDAVAAFEASAKTIQETLASLDTSKAPPEKLTETHGRLTAAAVAGVIIRQHVLPRLTRDLAALTARNKELETQMAKFKTAGTLSRAHAAAATAPGGVKAVLPEDNLDAAKMIAREMGVAVDA